MSEPEPADAVALIRAHLAGEEETIEQILAMVDERRLFPMAVGFLLQVLENAGIDGAELDVLLAGWQADRLT